MSAEQHFCQPGSTVKNNLLSRMLLNKYGRQRIWKSHRELEKPYTVQSVISDETETLKNCFVLHHYDPVSDFTFAAQSFKNPIILEKIGSKELKAWEKTEKTRTL